MVGGAEGEFKLSSEEIEAQELKKAHAQVENAEKLVIEDWDKLMAAYQRATESTFTDDGEGVWNVMAALLKQAGQESVIEEGAFDAFKEVKLAEERTAQESKPEGDFENEEEFPEEKIA